MKLKDSYTTQTTHPATGRGHIGAKRAGCWYPGKESADCNNNEEKSLGDQNDNA